MDEPLTFDEALTQECEHGITKIIVCPKCHPDKYVDTPEIIAHGEKLWNQFVVRHPEFR